MGLVIEFPKTRRKSDIEFVVGNGFYCVYGQSIAGVRFLSEKLEYEPSQGSPEAGIAIGNNRIALDIAEAALNSGCQVRVNGREL